jgi:hypothetical protein
MFELYLHFPIYLYSTVLNLLSKRTTLPYRTCKIVQGNKEKQTVCAEFVIKSGRTYTYVGSITVYMYVVWREAVSV